MMTIGSNARRVIFGSGKRRQKWPPPYDPHTEIMQIPEHAKAPSSRAQAKQFIRVLEMLENGNYGWRGEWLSDFPKYI
jgi:hypothetical protein